MIRYLYTNDYDDSHNAENFHGVCAKTRQEIIENPDQSQSEDSNPPTAVTRLSESTEPMEGPTSISHEIWTMILFNVKVYRLGDQFLIPDLKATAIEKIQACLVRAWKGPMSVKTIKFVLGKTESSDRHIRDIVYRAAYLSAKELIGIFGNKAFFKDSGIFLFSLLGVAPGELLPPHECPWPGCQLLLTDEIACMAHYDEVLVEEHESEDEEDNDRPWICTWPDCGKRFSQDTYRTCHFEMDHLHRR